MVQVYRSMIGLDGGAGEGGVGEWAECTKPIPSALRAEVGPKPG